MAGLLDYLGNDQQSGGLLGGLNSPLVTMGLGLAGGNGWGEGMQGAMRGLVANQQMQQLAQERALQRMMHEREFAFRQEEAKRAQGNTDRSFQLQSEIAKDKPQIVWKKDPNTDEEIPYLVPAFGQGPIKRQPIEGQSPNASQPANPYMAGNRFKTAEQAKDAGYTDRMLQSEAILSGLEMRPGEYGPAMPGLENQGTRQSQVALEKASGNRLNIGGTNWTEKDYQKYEQARRDWVNAKLRPESGAVINENEFANALKQYFPVPGDDAATIEQKRRDRMAAVGGVARSAGPNYQPEYQTGEGGRLRLRDQRGAQTAANPTSSAPPAAAPDAGPRKITSEAEYLALPSGTPYIAPDGTLRTKK